MSSVQYLKRVQMKCELRALWNQWIILITFIIQKMLLLFRDNIQRTAPPKKSSALFLHNSNDHLDEYSKAVNWTKVRNESFIILIRIFATVDLIALWVITHCETQINTWYLFKDKCYCVNGSYPQRKSEIGVKHRNSLLYEIQRLRREYWVMWPFNSITH